MGEARENEALGQRLREEQLRLPFDQHQRYRMIADVVELLRRDAGSLRLLAVGRGDSVIPKFLPDDKITILDQTATNGLAEFVADDASVFPFDEGAFDYVTCADVYEHIVLESRERYLSELRRTSRKGVLLAAPFDSELVRSAESVANEFHRSVHRTEDVRLKEHAEKGLPSMAATRQFFEGFGDAVYVLPNGYVPHWLAMICLTFYGSKLEDDAQGVLDRVNAFYNEFLYESGNTEPCYRHLLIALREPVDLDLDGPLPSRRAPGNASNSQTLVGALVTILTLATEMKRLSADPPQKENTLAREQTRLEGALARKEAQVEDLSRRLAERISAENARVVQADRHAARLQQDYDDLRRQEDQLQRQKDQLQRQKDQLQRQKDQLQGQLESVTSSRAWRLLTVLHKLRLGVAKILSPG